MFTLEDIRPFLPPEAEIRGEPDGKSFDGVAPAGDASPRDLTWIGSHRGKQQELAQETGAALVICDGKLEIDDALLGERCFVVVPSPKLTFSRIVEHLFAGREEPGVHPTAVVSPDARIEDGVHVGPFTYVGAATVGAGSAILGNCFIHDGVRIGRNVRIQAGCVVGGEGFGYERREDGTLEKFPHVGGVVIEDDVELHTLAHVDRGALGDTIVGRGAKIDSYCHIAHNVEIGEDTLVIANSMVAGSVRIGKRCWIGPSSAIRDGIEIGDDVMVGMGSLVVKDVPGGSEIMGAPAQPVDEYKRRLSALRDLK